MRIFLDWPPVTCYKIIVQNTPVKLLDVIALLEDKPAEGWVAGKAATIVEVCAPDLFEVELPDSRGKTGAVTELKREEPLVIKDEAAAAA